MSKRENIPSAAEVLAEAPPDFTGVPSAMTEKNRLARLRWREEAFNRLMSGCYRVWHEERQCFFNWRPPPWLVPFIEDWVKIEGLRAAIAKGRQIYFTATLGIIQLDQARFWPGAISLIYNQNIPEARGTLAHRIVAPLKETWPALAGNNDLCQISAPKVTFPRKEGHGGSSTIYAGEFMGRGQTPVFSLATEFPTLCATAPGKAEQYRDACIRGAQYANHFLEGTLSGLAVALLFGDIMHNAIEQQREGHWPPIWKEWGGYFFPWFCKDNCTISDEAWGKRKISKQCEDYFKKISDKSVEYQIGRKIYKGGVQLSEGKKRWYQLTWQNEANRDFQGMYADYPSLLGESMTAGEDAHYLASPVRLARGEGRVCHAPLLHDRQVHVGADIGWHDSTAFVYGQSNGDGTWRIIGTFQMSQWTSEDLIAQLRRENFYERTGFVPRIHLPHDADYENHTNQKITQRVGGTVWQDFTDCGFFEVPPPVTKPKLKGQNFAIVRQTMPKLTFDEVHCREFLQALPQVRIAEIKKDGVKKTELAPSKHNHLHDALVSLCYVIADWSRHADTGAVDYYLGRRSAVMTSPFSRGGGGKVRFS